MSIALPTDQPRRFPKEDFVSSYMLALPILIYEVIFILYPIEQGLKASFEKQSSIGRVARSGSVWRTTAA